MCRFIQYIVLYASFCAPYTVVVYAKMCRGELTRFIIKNRIENPGDLKGFKWEGFSFDAGHSTDTHYLFSLLS